MDNIDEEILAGTSGTSTTRRGRLFLWDHVAAVPPTMPR